MRDDKPKDNIGWPVWLSTILILVLLEVVLLQLTTLDNLYKHESGEQGNQYQDPCDNVGTSSSPVSGAVSRYLCIALYKNLWFIDDYHDTINAISTILVALFTATLWRTTTKLFKSGERSANALMESERAQIFEDIMTTIVPSSIYENVGNDKTTASTRVECSSIFVNYGKTPGTITEFVVQIRISDKAPESSDSVFVRGIGSEDVLDYSTLIQGQKTNIVERSRVFDIDWIMKQKLIRKQTHIWVLGHVLSQDIFGVIANRSFVWRYDRASELCHPYSAKRELYKD